MAFADYTSRGGLRTAVADGLERATNDASTGGRRMGACAIAQAARRRGQNLRFLGKTVMNAAR